MEDNVSNRIRLILKREMITLKDFCNYAQISPGTLSNMLSRGSSPSFEILYKIAKSFPFYSMGWLLTGEGEMCKTGNNAGTGNKIKGDNKGVIGNTGTIGDVACRTVSVNMDNLAKKIIQDDKIEIERDLSAQDYVQTIQNLNTRIVDLERLITTQEDVIKTQKLLIDKLNDINNKSN